MSGQQVKISTSEPLSAPELVDQSPVRSNCTVPPEIQIDMFISNTTLKKFHSRNRTSEEIPALSNRDIYNYLHQKKRRGYIRKLWRKTKRLFRSNGSDSVGCNLAGGLSIFLTFIPFFFLWQSADSVRQFMLPLQLGAATFFYLYILSRSKRETHLFRVSGVLAIPLAALVPVVILNLYSSWHTMVLFLPAHFAICGIAALYRSDVNLSPIYIFKKALSYLVFTLFIGWLSFYALNNL